MSHPANDTYLEYAMNEFEAAATRAEREVVIERLREEGFATQAQHLEQFVEEGGPDRSKEEREDR